MITGLNTDVPHQGKTYHVQTEDTGRKNATIVTILFQAGAILATRKTSYADIIDSGTLPAVLKERMNDQHRKMIEDLKTGRISSEPARPEAKPATARPPAASPAPEGRSPSASGQKKSLDDMILDYLSAREERKKP